MNTVNKSTANWRLFGGGGLAVGGALYALAFLLNKDGGKDVFWITVIGLLIIGVGLFFVARGETGSNGAVGGDDLGKIALYVAGGMFVLNAFLSFLVHEGNNIDSAIFDIIQIVTIVALAASAYVIANKGVAKGLAALALYVVAAWALLIQVLDWSDSEIDWWHFFILGLTLLGTGVLYLLNS